MSTRSQRGRAIQAKKRSPLTIFYVLLGIVAVVGIAALGTLALRGQSSAAQPGALLNRPPLKAPTGLTPDGYYYKGQPNAPVTVVEYSDFQCPFCGQFARSQEVAFDTKYVESGKVKYIFHDFPLKQHPNAVPAALAARCAGDQQAFWTMHDMLFANQSQWENIAQTQQQFTTYAQQLKLDAGAFQQCLTSDKYASAISKAQQEGLQIQIPGTPTFVLNGKQYDASQITGAIDAALQGR